MNKYETKCENAQNQLLLLCARVCGRFGNSQCHFIRHFSLFLIFFFSLCWTADRRCSSLRRKKPLCLRSLVQVWGHCGKLQVTDAGKKPKASSSEVWDIYRLHHQQVIILCNRAAWWEFRGWMVVRRRTAVTPPTGRWLITMWLKSCDRSCDHYSACRVFSCCLSVRLGRAPDVLQQLRWWWNASSREAAPSVGESSPRQNLSLSSCCCFGCWFVRDALTSSPGVKDSWQVLTSGSRLGYVYRNQKESLGGFIAGCVHVCTDWKLLQRNLPIMQCSREFRSCFWLYLQSKLDLRRLWSALWVFYRLLSGCFQLHRCWLCWWRSNTELKQ